MEKKFKLTNETIEIEGHKLYRIEALIDFGSIKKGDKGGFVEKEDNLSHEGLAWIYDNAEVYGDARVYGRAWITDNAKVYGNAEVFDDAWVGDNAAVYGDAKVYGRAGIYDKAEVLDSAVVYGTAEVCESAVICGNVVINDYVWVSE